MDCLKNSFLSEKIRGFLNASTFERALMSGKAIEGKNTGFINSDRSDLPLMSGIGLYAKRRAFVKLSLFSGLVRREMALSPI